MDFKDSYSFVEINIFPPQEEKYYQLFKGGLPQPFVYSASHLKKCFTVLFPDEKRDVLNSIKFNS